MPELAELSALEELDALDVLVDDPPEPPALLLLDDPPEPPVPVDVPPPAPLDVLDDALMLVMVSSLQPAIHPESKVAPTAPAQQMKRTARPRAGNRSMPSA